MTTIKEILALDAKATPAPWRLVEGSVDELLKHTYRTAAPELARDMESLVWTYRNMGAATFSIELDKIAAKWGIEPEQEQA